jgi:replicative DNA helicase
MGVVEAEGKAQEFREALSAQEVYNVATASFSGVKEACEVRDKTDSHDKKMLLEFIDEMEAACSKTTQRKMWPFYIPSLDEDSGGIEPGELVVVHGRTSTGKSVTGQHIIVSNTFEGSARSAIFTAEMPHKQYLRRITASLGTISLSSMRRGLFTKEEFKNFIPTVNRIDAAPLWIYDLTRNKMTAESVESEIRKLKKDQNIDMVLIDYLQLIKPDSRSKRREERTDEEMQRISASFKRLAGELELVVILLAQSAGTGMVHGCPQVESDADWVLGMIPTFKMEGGVKMVSGTSGLWVSKAREGARGRKIPIRLLGQFAQIQEDIMRPPED